MAIHSKILLNNPTLKNFCYHRGNSRAKKIAGIMEPYLKKDYSILDFGSGTCNITEVMRDDGYRVTPVDIRNISLVPGVSPLIYDGAKLSFKNDSFDMALAISVLHHTPNPDAIIAELKRVAKKILVIEDVFVNGLHKYATFLIDSVLNQEFASHPHSNRNDAQWKEAFAKAGLKLSGNGYRWWFIMRHAVYYLEK